MQKTSSWANTNYNVVYGQLKLDGDANEGAMVNVGTWRSGCEYIVTLYAEATPAPFAAIAWDDSFFLGVGASNFQGAGRVLVDYGIGGEKVGGGGRIYSFFPGAVTAASTDPCFLLNSNINILIGWAVNFLFDGTIQKQWGGFGLLHDSYLIILERGIF